MFPDERIGGPAPAYLAAVGTVFARFDQQDSGNLSYGVEIGGERVFVKTSGRPDDPAPVSSHAERNALLRNAIRLARAYRHPALPRLRQVVESPDGPLLVYDWVDGELLHARPSQRRDPTSAYRRFLDLPASEVLACLDTIVEVHDLLGRGGEVAGDFYDGCLIYDFDTRRVALVDLDSYRPGPYVNTMGRMFGSTRFMAPEELTLGAVIDQRTSVYTLGRTVFILLGEEPFRGSAALRAVAGRACRERPEDRYPTTAAFCEAWRTARA
jgi:serine/threonine-protein kinase